MATLQANNTVYVRLPNYRSGLRFLVECVKINTYVQNLESANKHVFLTRSEARDCWLRTLDLEYKKLTYSLPIDDRELRETSMQLYQKGMEQPDTLQWLVKSEREPTLATGSDSASQMSNHVRNVDDRAAIVDERINDLITPISNVPGVKEDDFNNSNSKQLISKQLQMQIAHRAHQEDSHHLHTANEMLDLLATRIYRSGLQDLKAQWLGPVPLEVVEKYKKTCMERARDLFKEHAQPEVKIKLRNNLTVQIESKAARDEAGLPSKGEVWDDKDQMIETRHLSNICIDKPFIDIKKPLGSTTESIERAALEMHRLQYVRRKQPLKGPCNSSLGLLNFGLVREALRLNMKADLNREVSRAEAAAQLNRMIGEQAIVFKMLLENQKHGSKETIAESKVKAATKEQGQSIQQEKKPRLRRKAKLQKRRKMRGFMPATGPNAHFNPAPSPPAQSGTHSLLLCAERAGIARPTPPTPIEQAEVKQERDDEVVSTGVFDLHMGVDRMVLQE